MSNDKQDAIRVTLVSNDQIPEPDPQFKDFSSWATTEIQVTYHELTGRILDIKEIESFILERLHFVEKGTFFNLDANHMLIVKGNGNHVLIPIKRDGDTITFENNVPLYFAPNDIAYLEIAEPN